ncbi:YkuS family protein [Halobacillus fulvus]|nr:YkuS family protein [Halobacillus fulvus]
MKKIAVEQSLSEVRSALQEKGYEIIDLKNQEDAARCDCCVISGQDRNVMGMMEATTKGAVIDAAGKSADEVCQDVEARFS